MRLLKRLSVTFIATILCVDILGSFQVFAEGNTPVTQPAIIFKPPQALAPQNPPPVTKTDYAWGESSNGFVVSLAIDKDTNTINDDITLHMACSRLTDDWVISGAAFFLRPCEPAIEIRDNHGKLVDLNPERSLGNGHFTMCNLGGSSGPNRTIHVEKEAVLSSTLVLNKACVNDNGFFDSKPGVYTVTAVWYARSEDPEVKVEVRSKPVTFHIVGN